MFNRKAVTKLRAILLIDIMIISVAAGTYIYLTSAGVITAGPGPAEFKLADFEIDPAEVEVGESVVVSFNLTNVGESDGNYTFVPIVNGVAKENVTIIVDDIPWDNLTIPLAPLGSSIVKFTEIESVPGNYTVQVGELNGTFLLKPAPPASSNLVFSSLLANPYEAWINEPIRITANVKNPTSETDAAGAKMTITLKDHPEVTYTETKRFELGAGEITSIEFSYNASNEGIYTVKMGSAVTNFVIVPTGYHSVLVVSSPKQGIDVTIDGEAAKTPKTALLSVGVPHTVAFPAADPTGKFGFLQWATSSPGLPGDGSKNPSREITISTRTTVKGEFSGGTSCPSLYLWNGKEWIYVSEISNHGWLGYIKSKDSSRGEVPFTFYANNPWDYIPVNGTQIAIVDNSLSLKLSQKWNEIFYLDQAYLMVVDHPSNVDVYSTMVEEYLEPEYVGQIYTVSKDMLSPVSAVNEKGENVLPQISKIDNIFTTGIPGIDSPSWDNIQWNTLTLNLGDLSKASQTKLVVRAVVDWGDPNAYVNWLGYFYDPAVPDGTEVTPPPFMEVKAENGSWVRVPWSRQISIPPDRVPRTFVVDLTGLFPTNDYSLRISNFWNVTFDYIGIDTTPQADIAIHKIDPTATLSQTIFTGSLSTGDFTRYGDVTELVTAEDDEFVIGRQGDEVNLDFSTTNLPTLGQGLQRDYFFFVSCWFKDENGNWGFGFGFTVDPLPFRNMSGFPYPESESYPYEQHQDYIDRYNTREIDLETQEASFPAWITLVTVTAITLIIVNLAALIYHKRSRVMHIRHAFSKKINTT